jgi:hypothetical protein
MKGPIGQSGLWRSARRRLFAFQVGFAVGTRFAL